MSIPTTISKSWLPEWKFVELNQPAHLIKHVARKRVSINAAADKLAPDYFGDFDFALNSRCTASALRISGLPCAHALSIIMRLKRHFSPSRVSSQS